MTKAPKTPSFGDQREMLIAFVDEQRANLLWKLEGLSDQQLRANHPVTGFCLLGLLKHLVRVEQIWFQVRLKGESLDVRPNDVSAWNPTDDEPLEVLADQYHAAWARSNAIARELPLDHLTVVHSTRYQSMSLQWVLLHMIEETARHLGHADVIRQTIDGAVGVDASDDRHKQRKQGS